MNRLSIAEIELYADWHSSEGVIISKLAKQLLDTMRENGRLRDALRHIALNCMGAEPQAFAKNILHSKLPEFVNFALKEDSNSCKHTEKFEDGIFKNKFTPPEGIAALITDDPSKT